MKNSKKWISISVIVICTFSFALSIYTVLKYNNGFLLGSMEKMNNDDVRYIRSGLTLLHKGMLVYYDTNTPTTFIMPGISFIMAFFIKLFGTMGAIVAFRLYQSVLHLLCLILIFLIARYIFNGTVAVIACLLDALYLPEYYSDGLILTEGSFKFLLLLLVYLSLMALQKRKTVNYLYAGVVWGLACLFRPTIALYPAAILLIWIIRRYSFKEMLRFGLAAVIAFAVIMSPWWIRNYSTFNKFIPLSQSSGNPMLLGTYLYFNHTNDAEYSKATRSGNDAQVILAKERIKRNFTQHPIKYTLWYTIGKTAYFWGDHFYWKELFGIKKQPARVYHWIILAFAITGLIMLGRKNKDALLILAVILYFNAVHLPYFTASRYSFPLMPLVMIFAAYGLFRVYNYAADKLGRIGFKSGRLTS